MIVSIVLYVVALGLSLLVVVPALKRAGTELAGGRAEGAPALFGRTVAASSLRSC